jgi:hypothetical protein
MVRWRAVKEPVVLPFFFLFAFLCAAVLFTALDLFAAWGLSSGVSAFSLPAAAAAFPRSALRCLVPAVVTALFVSGMRMSRRPFSRFLGLAICLAAGYVVLVNGMILLGRLDAGRRAASAPAAPYLPPRAFVRVGGIVLSADSVSGDTLRGVLAWDGGAAPPRMSVHPEGRVAAAEAGRFAVRLSGARQMTVSEEIEPPLAGVFRPDRFTRFFLRDIAAVTADLRALRAGALAEFFVSCFSLLLLWTSLLAVLRITRWPLINLILLALAVRGSFSLYHLLSVTLRPDMARIVTDPLVGRLLPSAALAAAGVVILLIDILFIPADRLKQVEGM